MKTKLIAGVSRRLMREIVDSALESLDDGVPLQKIQADLAEFLKAIYISKPKATKAMARFFRGLQQFQQAEMEIEELELSQDSPISEEADTMLLDRDNYRLLLMAVENELTLLNKREQSIIAMRFGFGGATPETQEEIGEIFNVTRERIRQILNRSLIKLRRKLGIIS